MRFPGGFLSHVCAFLVGSLSTRRPENRGSGVGEWTAGGGRALPNWSGHPGRDRCSGELCMKVGGEVDMAGGALEAEPDVLSDAVGVGHAG